MTVAAVVLAVALAAAVAGLIAGGLHVRKLVRDLRAVMDMLDQTRVLLEAAQTDRDAWKVQHAKAAAERDAAIEKVRAQAAVILAAREEFAAFVKKKQATATDAEAIDLVDQLIARRLN